MDDAKQKIIDGLKTAMEAEAGGFHFYTMTAEHTKDPHGKETFQALAGEEKKHLDFLSAQMKSMTETGKVDVSIKLGNQIDYTEIPIFSEEIISRAGDAAFEMSALSIGMQLEKSSIEYYTSQANLASNSGYPEVEAFYLELVKWERKHLDALSRQQALLKEDFWAQGGFAPF